MNFKCSLFFLIAAASSAAHAQAVDPFDPASCSGPLLTRAQVGTDYAADLADAKEFELGSFDVYQRVRTCDPRTYRCEAWQSLPGAFLTGPDYAEPVKFVEGSVFLRKDSYRLGATFQSTINAQAVAYLSTQSFPGEGQGNNFPLATLFNQFYPYIAYGSPESNDRFVMHPNQVTWTDWSLITLNQGTLTEECFRAESVMSSKLNGAGDQYRELMTILYGEF